MSRGPPRRDRADRVHTRAVYTRSRTPPPQRRPACAGATRSAALPPPLCPSRAARTIYGRYPHQDRTGVLSRQSTAYGAISTVAHGLLAWSPFRSGCGYRADDAAEACTRSGGAGARSRDRSSQPIPLPPIRLASCHMRGRSGAVIHVGATGVPGGSHGMNGMWDPYGGGWVPWAPTCVTQERLSFPVEPRCRRVRWRQLPY